MNKIVRKVVCVTSSAALAVALVPVAALVQPGGAEADAATAMRAQAAVKKPTVTVTRANTGKVALAKGMSYKLGAKASKGAKLTYKSSKKRVVTVSKKGKLKARKPGKATIIVRAKRGKKATTKKVRVTIFAKKKYKKVKKLELKLGKAALAVGKTTKAKVTFKPKKASNRNVVYKSSDKKVATVSAKGKVTAKGAGTAKITVTSCANKKAKASKKLTVATADKPQNPYDGPDSDGDGFSDALEAELGTDPHVANAEETLPNKDIYMPEVVQVEKAVVASAQVDEGSNPLSAEDDTITVSLSQLPDGVKEGAIAVFGPCEGLDHEQALKVSSIKGNASKGWTVIGSAPDVDEVFAYTKGHETVRLDPSKATIADGSSVTSKSAEDNQSKTTTAKSKRVKAAAKGSSATSKLKVKENGAEIGGGIESASGDSGISLSTDGKTKKGKVKTKYGSVSFLRDDEKIKVTFSFGKKASPGDGEKASSGDDEDKSGSEADSVVKTYELSDTEENAAMSISGEMSLTANDPDYSWADGASLPWRMRRGTSTISYEVVGDLSADVSFSGEFFICSIPGLSVGNDRIGAGLFVFLDINMDGKATLSLKCAADVTQDVTQLANGSVTNDAAIPQVTGKSPELSCAFEVDGDFGLSLRVRIGVDGCSSFIPTAMAEAGIGFGVHAGINNDRLLLAGGVGPHGGGVGSECRGLEEYLYLKAFAGLKLGIEIKIHTPWFSHEFDGSANGAEIVPIWGDGSEYGKEHKRSIRAFYLKELNGTATLDSYYPGVGYKPTTVDYELTERTALTITTIPQIPYEETHANVSFTWNSAHLTSSESNKVLEVRNEALKARGKGWPMLDLDNNMVLASEDFVNADFAKIEKNDIGSMSSYDTGASSWYSKGGGLNLSDTQFGTHYSIDFADAIPSCSLLVTFLPSQDAYQDLDFSGFLKGEHPLNKETLDTQAASHPFYLLLPLGEEDS